MSFTAKKSLKDLNKQELKELENYMEEKAYKKTLVIIIPLVIALVGILIVMVGQSLYLGTLVSMRTSNRGTYDNIEDMANEIVNTYKAYYNGKIPKKEEIEDYILTGVSLAYKDKYGSYVPPKYAEENKSDRDEHYCGVGVITHFEKDKSALYLSEILDNSPAKEAGIQVGEYITRINGKDLRDRRTWMDVRDEISGEEGTYVELEISRLNDKYTGEIESEQFIDSRIERLERKQIHHPSVKVRFIGDVPLITIRAFTNYTDEEFKEVLNREDIKSNTNKIVVDLRDNSGGTAQTVISMLDEIVPKGLIVECVGKGITLNNKFYSDNVYIDKEFVIIVNEYTASASELFTQCLRDYEKAYVVGDRTFGKGTILSIIPLSNGGELALSTGEYFTKSKYNIEGNGIEPDKRVSLPADKEKIYYKLTDEEDIQLKIAINHAKK